MNSHLFIAPCGAKEVVRDLPIHRAVNEHVATIRQLQVENELRIDWRSGKPKRRYEHMIYRTWEAGERLADW